MLLNMESSDDFPSRRQHPIYDALMLEFEETTWPAGETVASCFLINTKFETLVNDTMLNIAYQLRKTPESAHSVRYCDYSVCSREPATSLVDELEHSLSSRISSSQNLLTRPRSPSLSEFSSINFGSDTSSVSMLSSYL